MGRSIREQLQELLHFQYAPIGDNSLQWRRDGATVSLKPQTEYVIEV
jgi:hypothetical protein